MKKIRLDTYLTNKKWFQSRNIAKRMIIANNVLVNNIVCTNPATLIGFDDKITILKKEKYVSRAAYKLLEAIKYFDVKIENKICVDIGASTGGFTQVLIENNPKQVYCIDVGINQLDQTIKKNPKVINIERTNFKNVSDETFNQNKIDLIVCDVSFISSKWIIKKIKELNWKNFDMILLFKPQFEVGKKEIAHHKGLVKNVQLKIKVKSEFLSFCKSLGFKILGEVVSPIKGAKKQNEEFLLHLRK